MDPETFRTRTTRHPGPDEKPLLRFTHDYPDPPERVWRAITDSEEHSSWFGFSVVVEPVEGGNVTVTFSPEMVERARVVEIDEPRRFVYAGKGDVYRWLLSPHGDGCRLVLENVVGDPGHLAQSAAGFHLALDKMGELLDREAGRPALGGGEPSFDDLVKHYSTLPEQQN
ncbi:SRPBCC domain-containing protein [Micromonospora sp. RB23]